MCSINDAFLERTRTKSMFIGYLSKLRSNYGSLQPNIICIYLNHNVTLLWLYIIEV